MTSTYLVHGQENTAELLSFFAVNDLGFLFDPYEVGFRIKRGAVDVFPGAGLYEPVTTGPGHVGTGRFYAYDNTGGNGWTPLDDVDHKPGTFTVEWRWVAENGDDPKFWRYQFDVEPDAITPLGYRTYITPRQIRAECIKPEVLPDDRLVRLLQLAQQYIERKTRNIFRPIYVDKRLNGGEMDSVFLPYPIIGIESFYANENASKLDQDQIAVSFERIDGNDFFTPMDDRRRNPTIKMKEPQGIFDGGYRPVPFVGRDRFRRGNHNQRLVGVFGFLESDGSVPILIQEAMLRLILGHAPRSTVPDERGGAGGTPGGPIIAKTIDRHSVRYGATGAASRTKEALSVSKEVEEVIALYRAPIAIASPRPAYVW